MIQFKGKKVVVLGLGSSGFYAAKMLKDVGAIVFVSEIKDGPKQKEFTAQLKALSIDSEIGRHSKEIIENVDFIVLSPGMPKQTQAVQWAEARNIPVIGEIELGYQYCPAPIVAIGGTNGKSTVTTLVGKVLEAAGYNTFTLGNIGRPFCQDVLKMKKTDMVSLEVSSFQLESIIDFRPKVSVLLNFTPDHLDRYKNLEEYFIVKKRVFMNQTKEDFVVLNYTDPALRALENEIKAKILYFCTPQDLEEYKGLNPNHLAVLQVAGALNIKPQICLEVFKNFKGIEHRMEFVREEKGVVYVNDSKATNVESAIWALQNSVKPVVLLAGGRDKGSDFGAISNLVREKVKLLILFGEAKDRIKDVLGAVVDNIEVADIQEAVKVASLKAKEGDCVLLSPMCKSFDMFNDYKHRGQVFKEAVGKLT